MEGTTQQTTDQMLAAERIAVLGADAPTNAPLSALCLSGGGIRSAAFSLGVLQALAQARLLPRFDYLSTVSGGGYIGSWLQTLIHRLGVPGAAEQLRAGNRPTGPLHRLRNYTNYLTPRPGLLSDDVWTAVVLAGRNILLNWAVFMPLFLLAVMAAVFARTFVATLAHWPVVQDCVLALAWLLLSFSTFTAACALPGHRLRPGTTQDDPALHLDPVTPTVIWNQAVLPFLGWAALAPAAIAISAPAPFTWRLIVPVTAAHWLAYWVGYLAAWARLRGTDPNARLFPANVFAWLAATIGSAAFVALGAYLAWLAPQPQQAQALVVLGPAWLALAAGLNNAIYVGVRRGARMFDMDREWLARLSAVKLKPCFLWAGFTICTLTIPDLALNWDMGTRPFWYPLLVSLGSGPVAAWIGKQAFTRVDALISKSGGGSIPTSLLLDGLSALFAVALLAWLSYATQIVLGTLQDWAGPWFHFSTYTVYPRGQVTPATHYDWPFWSLLPWHLLVAAILSLAVWGLNHVNVNRFSMHAVYRNRLMRAFLGSARDTERSPDPFTQLDPNDNLPLSVLASPSGPRKLYPVINMTLNVSAGGPAAWAERKAMSFTATPLACGAAMLALPYSTGPAEGVFVPTIEYAGREGRYEARSHARGLTLATAMTISGAAVSPNWGYHSSPLTAFLMTLFDVRLGAWFPNPAVVTKPDELDLGRPIYAWQPLTEDLLGSANAQGSSIYLSDGGHFDNLGLYEMLRRRCRHIVVIDAGADPDCAFEDLGNALRKSAIDLRATVTFDKPIRIQSRTSMTAKSKPLGFAIAHIEYHDQRESSGKLLYIKPSILPGMPEDAGSYANLHEDFPHENTADQWFTESQFESYRSLGFYQMNLVIRGASGSFGRLFNAPPELSSRSRPAAARQPAPVPSP